MSKKCKHLERYNINKTHSKTYDLCLIKVALVSTKGELTMGMFISFGPLKNNKNAKSKRMRTTKTIKAHCNFQQKANATFCSACRIAMKTYMFC